MLRAQALDNDLAYARKALAALGEESMDRVTVELLMAVTRIRLRQIQVAFSGMANPIWLC